VVVTFDDGYVDNHDHALPLLRQHEVPATLFVTTCNIDSNREFWWDRLESLLLVPERLPDRLELDLPQGRVALEPGDAIGYSPEQRRRDVGVNAWRAAPGTRLAFYYHVWKTLWPIPSTLRDAAIDAVAEWTGAVPDSGDRRRTMTASELRTVAQSGWMKLGAHTQDHPPLPAHPESEQARQILESKRRLEDIIGDQVTTFAYPHGEHSPDTVRLLRDAGFECAVTVEQKLAHGRTDPMRLPRFGVGNLDAKAFEEQLGAWFGLPLVASEN
jgi:peptidoglycan/xylan/chitin deacetylase (PgdA/CDA1 family)